jgi:predicted dehydrogenase
MNPVRAELEGWIDAIRTDTDPPIPGEEGRAAVQIAEAAYTSIETGKPVHLK